MARAQRKTPCLETGGTLHAWTKRGLDVRNGRLVSVRTCVWCKTERTRKPKLKIR